jgi:hypothetical protein
MIWSLPLRLAALAMLFSLPGLSACDVLESGDGPPRQAVEAADPSGGASTQVIRYADPYQAGYERDIRQAPAVREPLILQERTWHVDKITASDADVSDGFGWSVQGVGDLNGDSFGDIVVGAHFDEENGGYSGSVYVYYGSELGLEVRAESKLIASDGSSSDLFGTAVSGAGDVNGDGFDDIIVGASDDDDAGSYAGSAYVYFGSDSGIASASETKLYAGDPAEGDRFGGAVAGAGDLDGDGYDDLVVGVSLDDDPGSSSSSDSGSAWVFYGSEAGIDSARTVQIRAPDAAAGDNFGHGVSGAGDVNGDGYDDLIVGAPENRDNGTSSGSAYLFYGSAEGVGVNRVKLLPPFASSFDRFGFSVAAAGDVNGDGYDDVVVGAPGNEQVAVFYGSESGVTSTRSDVLAAIDGTGVHNYGAAVSGAGDLNGDGMDDVIVGSEGDFVGSPQQGSSYVYYGAANGVSQSSEDRFLASDGAEGDAFGYAVSGGGDTDGDGLADLVVGAPLDDDDGQSSGAIYVYRLCADDDGDGVCAVEDCDDGDADNRSLVRRWYVDEDGDNFTLFTDTIDDCGQPDGRAERSADEDCDDLNAEVYPGAVEIPDDGIDQDCDGADSPPKDTGSGDSADSGEDSGVDSDSGLGLDSGNGTAGDTEGDSATTGCPGCASSPRPLSWVWVLLVGLLGRREKMVW